MSAPSTRALAGVVLALTALACQAPRSGSLEPSQPAATEQAEAPVELHHAEPAAQAEPTTGAPNRDLHGPADTERYISMLASDRRIEELKPDLVARRIYERANLTPASVVADIGCGPGVFDWPLAALLPAGHVLAIDVEPRQLDTLRAGILERGLTNVIPVLASYETPHIPPAGADVIFIADTYHHFEDRVAYFRGLRSALKPGGSLVLLEYKDGDLPIGPPAAHKVPLVERHAELDEAGYELVETLGTHIWHDFEFWRLRRAER
ncbi:MAG: methyltransferase domain-containing protein [Planctomycetota bacterium]|nr:methyltransferase domain-containing protein [Planctomycetota bacterium]